MNTLSSLPPGVTNYDIEEAAGAFDDERCEHGIPLESECATCDEPHEETRKEKIARLEAAGMLDPNCKGCREWYEHPTVSPFAPSHKAMSNCRSGRRPHCTCDTCF